MMRLKADSSGCISKASTAGWSGVKSPSVSWYIKRAAGVDKGSTRPGHLTVTTLSVRHVYEIAKVKQSDPFCLYMPLESICKSIIGTVNSMGIKIVKVLE